MNLRIEICVEKSSIELREVNSKCEAIRLGKDQTGCRIQHHSTEQELTKKAGLPSGGLRSGQEDKQQNVPQI